MHAILPSITRWLLNFPLALIPMALLVAGLAFSPVLIAVGMILFALLLGAWAFTVMHQRAVRWLLNFPLALIPMALLVGGVLFSPVLIEVGLILFAVILGAWAFTAMRQRATHC